MDIEKLPAAYQGRAWKSRSSSMSQELIKSLYWTSCNLDSEFTVLKKVILFLPPVSTPVNKNFEAIQHVGIINFRKLHKEMINLISVYKKHGVKVELLQPIRNEEVKNNFFYNLFFARDLFLATNEGVIISRMASTVRAGEEKHISKTIASLGMPILKTISGTGTFEGADAIRIRKDLVLIGTGNRTNDVGFKQVRDCLTPQGVDCVEIKLPKGIQHLLGILQVIDKDLAIVRRELIPDKVRRILRELNYDLIELDETFEITNRQAMNIVTFGPRCIIMVGGNEKTKDIFKKSGITILAEVKVDELLKGAGGIGCATGILERERTK